MNNTVTILSSLLPVLIMLGVGVICRRYSVFTRAGIDALKKAVVNICLPAVLINAFATMEYSAANILFSCLMFASCVLAWALGKACKRFFGANARFIPFITTGFEAGMLGYALYPLLYGADKISEFAIFDLGQVLFVFTLYKVLVGLDANEKQSGRELLRQMITSPVILAILAGILLGATGLYAALKPSGVSSIIDACTDFVSAPTAAMILIAIGYDLVFSEVSWGITCKAVGLRLAIMLAVRIVLGSIVKAFGAGSEALNALTVMCILPPPYVLPVFADDEKQRSFLSSTITVSTLVTILGFTVLLFTK